MHTLVEVWAIGGLALVLLLADTALSGISAFIVLPATDLPSSLRVILCVAFAFSILQIATTFYFATFYVKAVAERYHRRAKSVWTIFGVGTVVTVVPFIISGIALVSLTVKNPTVQSPEGYVLGRAPMTWVTSWFAIWGTTVVAVGLLFIVLGIWTRQTMVQQPAGRLDLDSGAHIPDTRRNTIENRPSIESTLASPPRTPSTTQAGSSIRGSLSATKAVVCGSRTKLIGHGSARSSTDTTMLSNDRTEDIAFDRWDTSSVHHEMRAVLRSSPPMTRPGLETIPGSRPDSPADALDGPFLPSSPCALQFEAAYSLPHATSSDVAVALDWSSPSRSHAMTSTPPSSPPPPNFSRPTSQSASKPLPLHESAQDMIHPLFRANSPRPPPIAIMGTTVTASSMTNDPITPETLARLRGNSNLVKSTKSIGHWKAMPSIELAAGRPNTGTSRPGSSGPMSPGLGSPGPSIYGDDELPPVIPTFVLSADNRSSLLGYSSRKSIK